MKKMIFAAPLAALLLFSGCRKTDSRVPGDASALYAGAQATIAAEISVLAEYPANYGVSVEWTGDSAAVEITAPADVAGVRASINNDSAEITYDGASIECFLPSLPGYAPADAIPRLLELVASGTPEDWCREEYAGEVALSLTYRDDFPSVTGLRRVWLRESDLTMLGAELFLDDSLVLRIRCTAFVLRDVE